MLAAPATILIPIAFVGGIAVATQAQAAFLRKHGCDQIQGYIVNKPVPVAEVESMLRREKNRVSAGAFPHYAPVEPGCDARHAESRYP